MTMMMATVMTISIRMLMLFDDGVDDGIHAEDAAGASGDYSGNEVVTGKIPPVSEWRHV